MRADVEEMHSVADHLKPDKGEEPSLDRHARNSAVFVPVCPNAECALIGIPVPPEHENPVNQ